MGKMYKIHVHLCLGTSHFKIRATLYKESPQSNDHEKLGSRIHKNRCLYFKQPREVMSKHHSYHLDLYLVVFVYLGRIFLVLVSFLVNNINLDYILIG